MSHEFIRKFINSFLVSVYKWTHPGDIVGFEMIIHTNGPARIWLGHGIVPTDEERIHHLATELAELRESLKARGEL